jgi:hypothetical protein
MVWQEPTAGPQPPLEARQLGSDKARSQQARLLIAPVENRSGPLSPLAPSAGFHWSLLASLVYDCRLVWLTFETR